MGLQLNNVLNSMFIRLFDIAISIIALLILLLPIIIISILIKIEDGGSIVFKQVRIGKNNSKFTLYKFRSMTEKTDNKSLLTIGLKDNRITQIGFFIRKYKIDELPQLINVIKGEMSLVGPRAEVEKYVNIYTAEQKEVLKVRPGITDYASIKFINENELLEQADNPERKYIEEILPQKIELNYIYIKNRSIKEYFKILIFTFISIIKNKND